MMIKEPIPKGKGIKLRKLIYPLILAIAILAVILPLATPVSAATQTIYAAPADGYIYSDTVQYTSARSASTGTVVDDSLSLRVGQMLYPNSEMSILSNKAYQLGGTSGYSRVGQKVFGFSGTITSVEFHLNRSDASANYAGTGYCRVYNADTNTLIGTVGSIDVATISFSNGSYSMNTTPVTVASPTNIIICFEYSGSYAINIKANSYSNTSWGYLSRYDGSTWSNLTNEDLTFYVEYKTYRVNRSFLYFDTSSIPAGATITNATLSLYGDTNASDTDFSLSITNGQPTYPSNPLTGDDFALSHYTAGGGELSTSGFTTYGYNTITLTTAGKGWINKGGTTKLGLFSNRDIGGNTPTGNEYVVTRSGNSGYDQAPYLYIEYTLAAPTVTTQAVTDITTTTATGNGNVTSDGGSAITERGIVWDTNENPTTSSSGKVIVDGTTGAYSGAITGLASGTQYHVRAYATSSAGTSYGSNVTFTAHKLPTVTSQAVSSIGITTATGNGYVTDLGIPNPTQHGVAWNTTGTPTTADSHTAQGAVSAAGAFTSSMTGLTASTTYYVRAYAINAAGTAYGNEVTFATAGETYTVTYNGNGNTGGSPPTDSNTYYQGDTMTVLGNTNGLTKTDCVFVGWNTQADGSGTDYKANDTFTMGAADVTLYAMWAVLDQYDTTTGTSYPVSGTYAQTFTAGKSGDLTTISYYLKNNYSTTVTVQIQGVTASGIPNGTVLGTNTATLPASASLRWVNVTFTEPCQVIAGKQYAIVWSGLTSASQSSLAFSAGNVYVNGAAFMVDYWSQWSSLTDGYDFLFKTYVYETAVTPEVPAVATQAVTGITTTTATGNGNVTSDGASAITERGIVWSTTVNPTTANNKVTASGTTGAFSASLTGLTPGTLYHVRAYAANSMGTSYGSDVTFTASELPTVTTHAVSSIGTTTATGNGNVTDLGVPNPTQHGVAWNTTGSPTLINNHTAQGAVSAAGAFTSSMTGLMDSTTYYVRAYATNAAGTVYGDEVSFTTTAPAAAPTVTTQAVTDITTTTATGNGTVTSDGGSAITERGIVWDINENPTTANSKVTASGTTGAFTTSLTGLTPGTLYHVRAYATNSVGTSYGSDVTFTAYKLPTVTTQAVSNIGTTTATGNGNVTDLGVPNPTQHGVVWNTTGSPTTADSHTAQGAVSAAGDFASSMTGFTGSTTYYVRAYATNDAGTVYGNQVTFTTNALILTATTTSVTSNYNPMPQGSELTFTATVTRASGSNTPSGTVTFKDGDATLGNGTLSGSGATATATYKTSSLSLGTHSITAVYGGDGNFAGSTSNLAQEIIPNTPNYVVTKDATAVGTTSATLNGALYNFLQYSGYQPQAFFQWGTTVAYGNSTYGTSYPYTYTPMGGNGPFSYALNGLSPGTTYHFRAVVQYWDGTYIIPHYGEDKTFTTGVGAPTVTTQAVTGITATMATGNGTVTSDGGSTITERGIVWATTENPNTTSSGKVIVDGTTGAFTGAITGLTPGTLYHVRAYAANSMGTSYGSDVTFTASEPLTVTYDGNGNTGGSPPTDSNAYYQGDTVTVLGNTGKLVKTGYTFTGWNTQAGGNGTTYTVDQTFVMGSSNMTLYAKWAINQYTITFNSNGGSSVTAITQDYGTAVSAPADPTRTGYTFAGWYSDADLTTPYTFTTMPAENITLYAKWAALPTYTVTYDANGATSGAVPTDSNTYLTGATVTVLGNTGSLVKTGYTFAGWNTAADGNGTNYAAGQEFTMGSSDVTLHAKWAALPTYTVTYDANEATSGAVPTDSNTYLTGATVTVLGNTGSLVKTGYTFAGWNTAADGNGTNYAAGQEFTMGSSDVTLHAKWAINQYTVTFDSQGGSAVTSQTVAHGGPVTEPAAPTKEGCTFGGWYTDTTYATAWNFATDTVSADITLYAKWTVNQYTITFDSNGGSSVTAITQDYGTAVSAPANPTRTGYTFVGWHSDAGLTTPYTFSTMPAENITLYAKWTINDQAPIITTQPQNITVAVGENAEFTVEYTGFPEPAFQWQLSTNNGKRWSNIAGANSDTYTAPPASSNMNRYQYRVILSNYLGSVTSDAATLTVTAAPVAEADVSITKTGIFNPDTNTITWTITVSCTGDQPVEGVAVTDILDRGTKFDSIDLSSVNGATYKVHGSTIYVIIGQLANGDSVTFTITAKVARATSPVYNTASVTTTSNDTDTSNNSYTAECSW